MVHYNPENNIDVIQIIKDLLVIAFNKHKEHMAKFTQVDFGFEIKEESEVYRSSTQHTVKLMYHVAGKRNTFIKRTVSVPHQDAGNSINHRRNLYVDIATDMMALSIDNHYQRFLEQLHTTAIEGTKAIESNQDVTIKELKDKCVCGEKSTNECLEECGKLRLNIQG